MYQVPSSNAGIMMARRSHDAGRISRLACCTNRSWSCDWLYRRLQLQAPSSRARNPKFRTLPTMFPKAVVLLASFNYVLASPFRLEQRVACSNEYRATEFNGVATAFSDATPGATAEFLQQLPLKDDAQLILYINGSPGIAVASTASLVRTFALGVRQAFYNVYPTSDLATTNYPNGTSHTELEL